METVPNRLRVRMIADTRELPAIYGVPSLAQVGREFTELSTLMGITSLGGRIEDGQNQSIGGAVMRFQTLANARWANDVGIGNQNQFQALGGQVQALGGQVQAIGGQVQALGGQVQNRLNLPNQVQNLGDQVQNLLNLPNQVQNLGDQVQNLLNLPNQVQNLGDQVQNLLNLPNQVQNLGDQVQNLLNLPNQLQNLLNLQNQFMQGQQQLQAQITAARTNDATRLFNKQILSRGSPADYLGLVKYNPGHPDQNPPAGLISLNNHLPLDIIVPPNGFAVGDAPPLGLTPTNSADFNYFSLLEDQQKLTALRGIAWFYNENPIQIGADNQQINTCFEIYRGFLFG